jgi:hypothetical protein
MILAWISYLVWRTVDRLIELSRAERGPVSDRGPGSERGLHQAKGQGEPATH